VRCWGAIRRIDSFTGNESGPKREAFPDREGCPEGHVRMSPLFFVQLFDLPLELARFTARCERGEHQLLGSLAPPPPLHEVDASCDHARGHRPDICRRIVGGNESVDRFR
jgi:hypothetical protein